MADKMLEGPLMQPGAELDRRRREARVKVRTRVSDEAERAMFMEMLGIDDASVVDDSRVPLAIGFDDRNLAARRRRRYPTTVANS